MNVEGRPQAPSQSAAKPTETMVSQTDIATLTGEAWDAFLAGVTSGYLAGIERGRELADEEAATLHGEAVRVVRALAGIDPWPVAEEKRRRHQLDAAADMQRPLKDAS